MTWLSYEYTYTSPHLSYFMSCIISPSQRVVLSRNNSSVGLRFRLFLCPSYLWIVIGGLANQNTWIVSFDSRNTCSIFLIQCKTSNLIAGISRRKPAKNLCHQISKYFPTSDGEINFHDVNIPYLFIFYSLNIP